MASRREPFLNPRCRTGPDLCRAARWNPSFENVDSQVVIAGRMAKASMEGLSAIGCQLSDQRIQDVPLLWANKPLPFAVRPQGGTAKPTKARRPPTEIFPQFE